MADEQNTPDASTSIAGSQDVEKKKKKKKDKKTKVTDGQTDLTDQSAQKSTDETVKPTSNELKNDGNKDKTKSKKKTGDKKDDKTKGKAKGPGKAMLAAMQEVLAKAKEEEARRLKEEEEETLRLLEIERKKEEEEKRRIELREKKKAKEKAKRDKLKSEGKYLTAKQKADRQRAQASLELLKQQGLIKIGSIDKEESKDDDSQKLVKLKNSIVVEDGKEEEDDKQNEEREDNEIADEESEEQLDEDIDQEELIVESWEELEVKGKKKKAILCDNKEMNLKNQTNNLKKANNTQSSKHQDIKNENQIILPNTAPSVSNKHLKHLKPNALLQQQDTFLRSPIVCVLGHVDTGKTKLLDYIRKTHVQDNEAGGITQQIGATFVPPIAIKDQCKISKKPTELEIPGLLIIDTPGHESFTNLRLRGSSLCDIAILVIDIMHGLEQQTIESIDLLKSRKTPFIVALNKIDRLYNWRSGVRRDIQELIASQQQNTKLEFEKRTNEIILQLNEKSLNAALYYENPDPRSYVSLVPTSAVSGDGMGNLINLISLYSQTMLHKKIIFQPDKLEATVLEVKALPGLGTTIDVVLVNGRLNEGDKIVLAGHDGPIVTQIRSLLVPQPLRELRVKSPYQELKSIKGSIGVKICGHDLDKAVAGLELYVAKNEIEIERLKKECWDRFGSAMKAIKCTEKGVYVQASTLGSLEALLEFLKKSNIPVSGVRIGPVVKRDVMKASIMLENSPDHAVILAFDVKVERDAQEMADNIGLKIFTADIIYHLFDKFTAYKDEIREKRKMQYRNIAVFPCKLKILPNCIFNARNPIVIGVSVEDGIIISGTPIAIPSKDFIEIGRVASIEYNHKVVDSARKGQEVCLKIEHYGSDAPKLYGRHFDNTDMLMSKITRESIDACKEYFRDELTKDDWKLMIELKNIFKVI